MKWLFYLYIWGIDTIFRITFPSNVLICNILYIRQNLCQNYTSISTHFFVPLYYVSINTKITAPKI